MIIHGDWLVIITNVHQFMSHVLSHPYQSGITLILWIAVGHSLRRQEMLVVTSVGCIVVLLLIHSVVHIHYFHILSEVGNMTVGLTGARVAFMWCVKTTRIAIPPVVVSLDGMGWIVARYAGVLVLATCAPSTVPAMGETSTIDW